MRLWWTLQALFSFEAVVHGAIQAGAIIAFAARREYALAALVPIGLGFAATWIFAAIKATVLTALGHPVRWWVRLAIAASLVAWLAGGAVSFIVAAELGINRDVAGPDSVPATLAVAAALGLTSGLVSAAFQWVSLRRIVRGAARWFPISAVGAAVHSVCHILLYLAIGAVVGWTLAADGERHLWGVPPQQGRVLYALWLVLGSAVASLASGLVTTTGLTWLLGQSKDAGAEVDEATEGRQRG